MNKTGADILLQTLQEEGIEVMFGYPGASSLPIHDRLSETSIRHYLVRHEQAAAHAADGYARATGKVGVCMSTSGPGATNLVTGIATAYMDSTPLVALTGQVTTNLLGSDAFQETDIIGITMPITKHSFQVDNVHDIEAVVKQAIEIAQSNRPGPVLVDLPRDIVATTRKRKEENIRHIPKKQEIVPKGNGDQLARIARQLNQAERPVIIIGGGVKLGNACNHVAEVITQGNIPFVTTMMGIGSVFCANGFNLGFIGTHGNELANLIIHQSDFILALGTRFSDRSTSIIEEFAPLATIAQIDIDPTSVGKNIKVDIPLISDIQKAMEKLIPLIEQKDRGEWLDRIKKEKASLRAKDPADGCGEAGYFIRKLQERMPDDTIATSDVGLNQIWTVRSWQARTPRSLLTSGGMGTMGFSLPAAIGAKIGNPDSEVISFSGDGGFLMNMQELGTIGYYNVPVKMVVFNNGHLGMIRQLQDLMYGSRFRDSELGNKVDIVKVANGFGIAAARVNASDSENGIEKLRKAEGPFLLEVMVDPSTYVFPIIPPGRSNIEMIYNHAD